MEQKSDKIADRVAESIERMGYKVRQNIGNSHFKIDIAIVDNDNPERYKTGIIIDNPSYFATPTVRDREIVRPAILGALGWDVCNVWSVDWIENEDKCLKMISEGERASANGRNG